MKVTVITYLADCEFSSQLSEMQIFAFILGAQMLGKPYFKNIFLVLSIIDKPKKF